MKRAWKSLALLTLLLSLCSTAWAFRDEPRDFNGIQWGTYFDSVRDQFRPAHKPNSGGNYYYEHNRRFQTWKIFNLNSLIYVFDANGQFKEAQGSVSDGRSFFEDAAAFGTATWGNPVYGTSNRGYRKASWFGRTVNIVFVEEYGGWRFICTWLAPTQPQYGPGGYPPPQRPQPGYAPPPQRPQPGYAPPPPPPQRPYRPGDHRAEDLKALRGYHGLLWGASLRDYRSEFTQVSNDNGVRLFVRRNDDRSLAGMRAEDVYYSFDRNGLQSVVLNFRGGNRAYERLFEIGRSLWGRENMPRHALQSVRGGVAGWAKRDGSAVLAWDSRRGTGMIILQRVGR